MKTSPHFKTNTIENVLYLTRWKASHAEASSIPRYSFYKIAASSAPSTSLRLHEHETQFQLKPSSEVDAS